MIAQAPAAAPPAQARTRWTAAAVALAAAVLFAAYLRQSQSVPVPSDGSGNVLQAWDMLHGNLLLHGWWVSDVSFITTELPQYLLIETVLGPVTSVVNVAAAMSYTLLILLAALLAKGQAPGREGACRALLAAGIMVSPQLSATPILLLSPDHTGTAVPMLVSWLVIDRFRPVRRPRPWLRPALAGVILTWTMIADSVVLVTVVVPLLAVCAARGRRHPDELWLAAAAAVAAVAGLLAPRIVAAAGGYRQWGLGTGTTGQLPHAAWITCQAVLELFGANVFGARSGIEVAFAVVHLAGVALVAWAVVRAWRRRRDELLVPVFAVAIAVNVAAYLISTHSRDVAGAREMAAVLPLGAVLAGRLLGERVLALAGTRRAAAAAAAVGYLAALCYAAAQPPAPPASQPLAAWLVSHEFRAGLAGYWQASSTTVDTRGRVLVGGVTVSGGRVVIYKWETDAADYDPARHDANFVVTGAPDAPPGLLAAAERTFGRPRHLYRYRGYTIAVWDANLLLYI